MFFAACGVALRTSSRKRLADRFADRGKPTTKVDTLFDAIPSLTLMTGMVRACLSLVLVLAIFHALETAIEPPATLRVYLWTFLIAGAVVTVFVVAVPASWGKYHREGLLVVALPLLLGMNRVFTPVLRLLHLTDPIARRVSGHDLNTEDQDVSDELLSAVEESEFGDQIDDEQKDMIEAVFDLPTTDAADLMTPRTEVEGIEVGTPIGELLDRLINIGHSRIPVYEESLDNVLGVLYVKDLLPMLREGVGNGALDLRQVVREPFLVPETKKVSELLADFKQRKVQLALVLDEYGGTAGVITLEDIFEEIVGDIQDEYEHEEEPEAVEKLDERTAVVDARTHIADVNDALDIDLPEDDDYDTLGGFVFAELGHVPEQGEVFEREALRFTVLEAERTRVLKVRVEKRVMDGKASA